MIDKNMKVNVKEILDKEFPDERYSEKCYICDPNKNDLCPKDICHINGGPCYCTNNKEFEKKQTNQDYFAELIRKMDPKVITEFWTNHTYVEDCDECPAHEYCNKRMLYSEDGWDRIPDENGEILECQDIFERWLKEEYSSE